MKEAIMEEIKLTPEELKKAIDFGKLIGSGFFSSVFTYKGRLIKMDNVLYKLLKANDPRFARDVINDHYRWNQNDFNDRDQLEELAKRQSKIIPKVPEGIITIKDTNSNINGISPGIIIPHFKDYENLKKLSPTEYKQLLIILKKVLNAIKSLADNEIAQEDIFHVETNKDSDHSSLYDYNIVYKGNDAQMIDLSGPMVKVGKDFTNANGMYKEFAELINHYYQENNFTPIYNSNDNITEDNLSRMITEFDRQAKKR